MWRRPSSWAFATATKHYSLDWVTYWPFQRLPCLMHGPAHPIERLRPLLWSHERNLFLHILCQGLKSRSWCVPNAFSVNQCSTGLLNRLATVVLHNMWALFFLVVRGLYTKAIPSRMPSRSLRRAAFYAEGAFAIWHVFKNAFATAFADLFLAGFRTKWKKFAKRSFYCKTWNLEPWTTAWQMPEAQQG